MPLVLAHSIPFHPQVDTQRVLNTHSRNEALGPLPIIQCIGWNGAHLQKKEVSLLRPMLSYFKATPD